MADRPSSLRAGKGTGVLIVLAVLTVTIFLGIAAWLPQRERGHNQRQAAPDAAVRAPAMLSANQVDASDALVNFSISIPGFDEAIPGDDGAGPLPLGTVNELPGPDYLNFLFEFCEPECYRDAHFMNEPDATRGSGPWTAGRPFHVRHGFINDNPEPLGVGFDVLMYITLADEEETGGNPLQAGRTYRLTSDYVVRGLSDQCGPTYKAQTEPMTCEWFVHDFPAGLPNGRYDLWAVWVAPCAAWIDLGYTQDCDDPAEVISLFSSGVNSPFGSERPSFSEANEG